jgi:hypothetical protein
MFHQLGMVLATPPASVDPISNNNNDPTSKRIFTSFAGADSNSSINNNIQKNLEPLVICGPSGVGKCQTTVFLSDTNNNDNERVTERRLFSWTM